MRRPPREQIVDVALAVAHHGDRRRRREAIPGDLGAVQPATRLLLVRRPRLVVADWALGAVQHHAVDQPDHTAIAGIDRQHRMQEQTGAGVVGVAAEAALAGLVRGEAQVGGVHDRHHMPPGGTLVGEPGGTRQHLLRRHRRIGHKAAELHELVAVFRQLRQAQRAFAPHRRQQRVAHTGQTFVAEPPKLRLDHARTSYAENDPGIDSESRAIRNSFRSGVTTVGA